MSEEERLTPSTPKPSALSIFYDCLDTVIIAVVCVVLIFTFVFRTVGVSGKSMLPTLQNGERLLITHIGSQPQYGDIVVVIQPDRPQQPLIKRVIATEGQKVDIDFASGIVYVDDIPLEEPYTNAPTHEDYGGQFPQVVPQGHVFVMGDNRNASTDSRDPRVGMVDVRNILGKVFVRFLPASRFGRVA